MDSEKKGKMCKEKVVKIIEKFHLLFPGEMEFEMESLILNEVGNFNTLIIIPKNLSPEKLMFELEQVVEVNSFIEANEFYEIFDLVRRQKEIYVLLLDNSKDRVETDESITLFEGLLGFLFGSLSENYCTGSSIKNEPGYYPYFIHNEIDGGLLVISKSLNNKFLRTKRIRKIISL